MTTLAFPNSSKRDNRRDERDLQAQKKDIAALLSNHVLPNPSTSINLSDANGKTVSLNCNADNAAELLDLAIGGFLNS